MNKQWGAQGSQSLWAQSVRVASMKLPSMEADTYVPVYSFSTCVHATYMCMCSDLCVHMCVQLLEDQGTAWGEEGEVGRTPWK